MNSSSPPSRATSISRASKPGSSTSRTQSLIKKNIAPQDLRPSDVLIERFNAWKAIVKQLIAYFEGIADIENNTARELTKLGAVIQVPFRAGNQFLGEGGLQDVFYSIRDKTRNIADHHANLGRTVDSSIVQHLQKLRTEIKAHIKNVENDTGKLATSVAKERELSIRLVADLTSSISAFKNDPMHITARTDPFVSKLKFIQSITSLYSRYVSNQAVFRQLNRQVHEENLLQKSIVIMQQNSAHFEEGIVRAIQSAWQTFDEWQSRASISVQESYRALSSHLGSLAPDREWISFAARSDHLLDPETPLRNPEHIMYPSKDDPAVVPVHIGHLERKKRFTRTYREAYYVLTAAGFLHEYASSDPASAGGQAPVFSLFLPACTLGPPSSLGSNSNKFHIEGRKDGTGATKTGSFRVHMRPGQFAWSFRARSREDMMEWWNDIRMLCARYLVASEQLERSGPVTAAVRAAGYLSEEEEGEAEGSSIEEGREEELGEGEDEGREQYVDAPTQEGTEPPDYSHHERYSGVEMGHNGYTVRLFKSSRNSLLGLMIVVSQSEKKTRTTSPPVADRGTGANTPERGDVNRKLSKRQQEKAPIRAHDHAEGEYDEDGAQQDTLQHDLPRPVGAGTGNDPGIAPVDSRFTEGV
ncbi:hypothetical protein AMATHDRAFT_50053 [Amanita thiersii Skay4041]|uniref:PH domain-containing protein n=1 Tax=Amanita thiersii Skay4041 TaxID=703135 RepID=A0A2A9NJB6_9AGAR|nr:hypothetical protein AMATHDRAFT_50053 [Amanita thiersii Skay4041]